ncbi:hypothetical protein ARMGADRAFT_219495 [Armillaria gallica]|uniref:Uncharacterized protein n=1 Tax=Armillaria gallica TaxID=47427 RepID=A0A2H3DV04_ARMGA|nr:hypothetical protein ARMGADRAFT_219495 [Armillaria gallica]
MPCQSSARLRGPWSLVKTLDIGLKRDPSPHPGKDALFCLCLLLVCFMVKVTELFCSLIAQVSRNPQITRSYHYEVKLTLNCSGCLFTVALFHSGVSCIYSLGRIYLEGGPTHLHTLKSFHGSQTRRPFTMATFVESMLVSAVAHDRRRGSGAVTGALSRWLVFKSAPE